MSKIRKQQMIDKARPDHPANDPQVEPFQTGAAPNQDQVSGSPALALQAQLHKRVNPRHFDMTTRFVTLLLALSVAGTWFAADLASLSV